MNILKQTIRRIKASLFLQNTATLATGTTLAQAVSVFTAPILYRIYDKEDYGTLGLYMAIIGVISVFSTMQYNHAILLEKEDYDAKVAMWLNRLINAGVTIITLLGVIFFGEKIGSFLGNEKIASWLFLAPISIFFSGQGQIFSVWANRKKKYKLLTYNSLMIALLVPLVSISIGLFDNGPFGLFMGLVVSHTLPSIILLIMLKRHYSFGVKYLNIKQIKLIALKYKKFPIFSLPSDFVEVFTKQIPVFFLSRYIGPSAVGIYSLAIRFLVIPVTTIGNAIRSVYQQRATESYNNNGDFVDLHKKTFFALLLIATPLLFLMYFLGPQIFSFFFGADWTESGEIASYLAIMYSFGLVGSPLSFAYFIKGKLIEKLIVSIILMLSTLVIFEYGLNNFNSILTTFLIYTVSSSLIKTFIIIRSFQLSKK